MCGVGRSVTGRLFAACRRGLGGLDVCSLLALGASGDVERYALAFLEGLEAAGVNCRVVREEILSTIFGGDEAKTFCVVKPFHCTCCHMLPTFVRRYFAIAYKRSRMWANFNRRL